MFDCCAQTAEKRFRMVYARHRIARRNSLSVVDFGQPFDLLHVENRVALHVRDFTLDILAGLVVMLGPCDSVRVDDE